MPSIARNNPSPKGTIILGNEEYIIQQKQELIEDYKFYAKALRIIYNKPKLRKRVLNIMNRIESALYYESYRQSLLDGMG